MSPAWLFLLAAVPVPDISVPPGFSASLVADNTITPDISTMTIDDDGRVLVAGRGYVRVLSDDRAIDLLDGLKDGPMGLFAEGDSLYVVTNGGLQRYRGYNGKDKLTQPPETLVRLKTVGEHDAHAVRRGPDGWLYLLCGNMAGVSKQTITSPRSPVKEPVAGALLRISPDQREIEVVADGFRNPYSFDFNLDGEAFAYDSDNERCVGLPWYEYCRFYHVIPGGNHGWRSPQLGQFWRKPPYFADVVPPVAYTGRGSPTGVACYRHTHFPEKYQGGFFLADWTFGRIHYVPLTAKGSTYEGKPEVFASAVGTSGFAPTALAVHPKTGELFLSIGGRGTRGGVYRITHDQSAAGKPLPMTKRPPDWTEKAGKQWLALAAEVTSSKAIPSAVEVLKDKNTAVELKLRALRIIQLALGDLTTREAVGTVFEGYTLKQSPTATQREEIERVLEPLLDGGNADVEREAFRTLAGIQAADGGFARRAVRRITADSDVRDDIGYLTVIARTGPDSESAPAIAEALLRLDRKAVKQNLPRDTFWPLRVSEIAAALGKKYPKLAAEILNHQSFGQPEHLLFVKPMQFNEAKAAQAFIAAADKDTEYRWTPGVIDLLGSLPAETRRPLLVKLWERTELREAILKVLPPQDNDGAWFVNGLASFDPQMVSRSATTLSKLPAPQGNAETVAAVKALRRLGPDDKPARAAVASLLQKRTGQTFDGDANKWHEWLTKTHPDTVALLAANDGFDLTAWKKRESGIVWDKGDVGRGKAMFTKASCAACHDGGRALGPSLLGIGKRFGRDDLLTAIVQPNKDVSPRYRPTRITTEDGKVFVGVLIYEATDGVILQTNADTAVRVGGENIASKRPVETSPMPTGLLDKLTDAEIADLVAYLRSLEEPKK